MFKLYYLVDQLGDIHGDKYLNGTFASLALAQAHAASDGMAHYSVEQLDDNGAGILIAYIV